MIEIIFVFYYSLHTGFVLEKPFQTGSRRTLGAQPLNFKNHSSGRHCYMIDSRQDLLNVLERTKTVDSVALDTEFIWERTFYPRLGLIQLALSDEECYLIDPLAIEDLSPLGKLLTNEKIVKIIHDAPQDLAILSRATKSIPVNIFDTRLAAGFSGLSATISLGNLVSILLEIDLPKTQTRTNWLHRPLDEQQISYALDDVRYLRALRILLLTRIVVPEIKRWLQDELDNLNDPESYMGPGDYERFQRVKGVTSLNRDELSIIRELAAWREQEARHLNRPRGHILTDKNLLELTRSGICNEEELSASTVLPAKKSKRHGQAILKAINNGKSIKGEDRPQITSTPRLKATEKLVFERLQEFVRLKCDMQGIDPQLIGTTTEFKQLAKNLNSQGSPLPQRLTKGWRKHFLEEFFRQRR